MPRPIWTWPCDDPGCNTIGLLPINFNMCIIACYAFSDWTNMHSHKGDLHNKHSMNTKYFYISHVIQIGGTLWTSFRKWHHFFKTVQLLLASFLYASYSMLTVLCLQLGQYRNYYKHCPCNMLSKSLSKTAFQIQRTYYSRRHKTPNGSPRTAFGIVSFVKHVLYISHS